MRISRLFLVFGRFGTVAVDLSWIGAAGFLACALKRFLFDPVKEDTRAELYERGYTTEEIGEAEDSVKHLAADGIRYLFGRRDEERLPIAEEAEAADIPDEEQNPDGWA